MKNHLFLFSTLALFTFHAYGADGRTALETHWFTFVSLTPMKPPYPRLPSPPAVLGYCYLRFPWWWEHGSCFI